MDFNSLFLSLCGRNLLKTAKFIYSLGKVDVHFNDNQIFKSVCDSKTLSAVKYVYSLGDQNIHKNTKEAFIESCKTERGIYVSKFLYSLGTFPIELQSRYTVEELC